MRLELQEQSRGVKVYLVVEIDAQALGLPCAAAQSGATSEPDREQFSDECLDSVHIELLQMLRQARLAAERSLDVYEAQRLQAGLTG
jgi:hypothetical protein